MLGPTRHLPQNLEIRDPAGQIGQALGDAVVAAHLAGDLPALVGSDGPEDRRFQGQPARHLNGDLIGKMAAMGAVQKPADPLGAAACRDLNLGAGGQRGRA